jgi:CheY-like chemotaxis protein
MHLAIRDQDGVALGRSAHLMKSSSAQLGAEVLARACGEVEEAADRGDLRGAVGWVETVDVEFAAFTAWLAGRHVTRMTPVDAVSNANRLGRRTIAVVEDNADNRLLVDAILGARFELHDYVNGGDALTGMAHRKPDLVLLDVSLPGMDGVEVVARIRRDPSLARIPVIALTAHAMSGDRERYLAAGFDGYVAKPIVDERDLTDTVERLLEQFGMPATGEVANADRRTP